MLAYEKNICGCFNKIQPKSKAIVKHAFLNLAEVANVEGGRHQEKDRNLNFEVQRPFSELALLDQPCYECNNTEGKDEVTNRVRVQVLIVGLIVQLE